MVGLADQVHKIAAANFTAAQAKEQVEYDKAVRRALKAMEY